MAQDKEIDPITLEVVRNKLDGIVEEMQLTLVRSAFSSIVKEGLDATATLFTIQGETLAQACAVPVHLGSLAPMVRRLLEAHPVDTLRDGDIFILNDYYLGGTHLPDIGIMMPIFAQGRPIAISATMAHHQDIGGAVPGSTPTNATSIFQEGLRIPLLKYREAGVYNDTLIKIMRQNSRLPDTLTGDINAQIAACSIGARRLVDLVRVYGDSHLLTLFDELLDRSELMTRQALRSLPAGTYRYVDYLDNDGVDLDRLVRIEVAVTLRDGAIECDFAGSSQQLRGPFNCVPSGPYAAACFAIRAVTDPDMRIPNNGGCFRPIKLVLPEGSCVNPREPAPGGCRSSTIKRIAGCILGALRQATPRRVPADGASEMLIIHFGGRRDDGRNWVTSQLLVAGAGASHRRDGVDVCDTDVSNCLNVPAEAVMREAPLRIHRVAVNRDSGGAGTFRGGLGGIFEYELLEGEASLTYRGERHFCQAAGFDGGQPGGLSKATIRRLSGETEVIPSKIVATLRKGDRLIVETGGGGGYGKPSAREPGAVRDDIRDGKIGLEAARRDYAYGGPG